MRIPLFLLLFVLGVMVFAACEDNGGAGPATLSCIDNDDCPADRVCVESVCKPYCDSQTPCVVGICNTNLHACVDYLPTPDEDDSSPEESDVSEEDEEEIELPCEEGSQRCPDSEDGSATYYEVCRNERWILDDFCAPQHVCVETSEGVECREVVPDEDLDPGDPDQPGEIVDAEFVCEEEARICDPINPDLVLRCYNNTWIDDIICNPDIGFYCEDGECIRSADYDPDIVEREIQCDENSLRCRQDKSAVLILCTGGWEVYESCSDGSLCVDNRCVTIDGEVEEVEPCDCTEGPCCEDGCHFKSTDVVCDSFVTYYCPESGVCGGDVYERRSLRYCRGNDGECSGRIEMGDLEVSTDCAPNQVCEIDATTREGSCLPKSECACECKPGDGPCCGGCYFKSAGTVCEYEAGYEVACHDASPEVPYLCGGHQVERYGYRVCNGSNASCNGDIVWPDTWDTVGVCPANEHCIAEPDFACEAEVDGIPGCSCRCETGDGPCCDGCSYLPAGTPCPGVPADQEEYGCPDGGLCGGDRKKRMGVPTCTGYGSTCEGETAWGDWEAVESCSNEQICTPDACLADDLCACNCNDSEGPCCVNCHWLDAGNVCDENYSLRTYCPWGTANGSDVGLERKIRYCNGTSSLCAGRIEELDPIVYENCEETGPGVEHCSDGECINVYPCSNHDDCDSDEYCRQGDCRTHRHPCNDDGDCPGDMFCNTLYGECLPLVETCEVESDCHGHPDGAKCDTDMHFCYGDQCNPERNNCRPGLTCAYREQITLSGTIRGYYCGACTSHTQCSPGQSCRSFWFADDFCMGE